MKKQLNFFPYYRPLLESGQKTATIRLTNRENFAVGDEIDITSGWSPTLSETVRRAVISAIYEKRLSDLNEEDFKGESPDCQSPYPTALVLGALYRTVVEMTDHVWVVKFRYHDV